MQEITSAKALKSALSSGVVLLDFNAPCCGPCRVQEPILLKLSDRYAGRVAFAVINIEDHRNLAARFQIRSIPTLIVFKDGMEILRLVGFQGAESLTAALDDALS
jgi:thioredoxin 1